MISNIPSRKMGLWETYCSAVYDFCNGTANTGMVIYLEGDLKFEILHKAFELLFAKHPTLRATIACEEDGYYLKINAEFSNIPIKQAVIQDHNPNAALEYLCKNLNAIYQTDKFLWQASVLTSNQKPNKHYLLVYLHHAIMDGFSQIIITRDLLAFYEKLLTGTNIDISSLPLLPSIEQMLPGNITWEGYQEASNKIIQKYGPLAQIPYSGTTIPGEGKSHAVVCDFNEEEVSRLKNYSKKNQIKINSLIGAALLLASNKVDGISDGLYLHHSINLRNHAVPNVSNEHVGCFVCTVKTIHKNIKHENLLNLAMLVQNQLIEDIPLEGMTPKTYDIKAIRNLFESVCSAQASRQHFINGLGITNWGNVELPQKAGNLIFNGIHRAAGRQNGDFPFFLHIATINNFCYTTFSYSEPFFSKQRAEDYATEFHRILSRCLD